MVGLTIIALLAERVALMVSEFASYTPLFLDMILVLGVRFIVLVGK